MSDATTRTALPLDDWRQRWMQRKRGTRLHRVAEIVWRDDDQINGHGITVCGERGFLDMPGILSRMGAPRCPRCCKALGVPQGDGAPYNDKTLPVEVRDA